MRSCCLILLSLCAVGSGFAPSRHTTFPQWSSSCLHQRYQPHASTEGRRKIYSRRGHRGRGYGENPGGGRNKPKAELMYRDMYRAFRPVNGNAKNDIFEEKRIAELEKVENDRLLTAVLASWAKSHEKDAAERCREVLDHLKLHRNTNLSPNKFVYGVIIDAYARRNQAKRAEAVLRELMSEAGENYSMMPSAISFNSVVNAWSKSNAADAPHRCMALLKEMSELAQKSGRRDLAPDVVTYTCVIDAFAKRGDCRQAEEVFREMWTVGDENVLPNSRTFCALMHAWTKSASPDALAKCKQLLADMYEFAEHYGKTELAPTVVTYTTMIDAFAQRGQGPEAEALLRKMLADGPLPNTLTFNSCINAWSKSVAEDAPVRCMELMKEMKTLANEKGEADLLPDVFTYTTLIDVFAKRGLAQDAENILRGMLVHDAGNPLPVPNVVTVASVMNAWAQSDVEDAPDRCRRLLVEIDQFAEAQVEAGGQNHVLRPNVFAYNAVVNCYAKRGRPAEAEKLLREMLDGSNDKPLPDVVTFSSVMNAYAHSDTKDAPERCSQLLGEMRELAKAATGRRRHQYEPSVITYNTVITAYRKHGLADEADDLLREMLAIGKPVPNATTFSAVMLAWLKCPTVSVDEAVERCESLFEEMKRLAEERGQRSLLPQKHTYGIMISMYEKAGRDEKAEELRRRLEQRRYHIANRIERAFM